jgi:ferritin
MISQKVADRINLQINREMYSAFLYMAMSAKMTEAGYDGVGQMAHDPVPRGNVPCHEAVQLPH